MENWPGPPWMGEGEAFLAGTYNFYSVWNLHSNNMDLSSWGIHERRKAELFL